MVFVPRPATLFYRGSSPLLLTPELVAARPRKRERWHTRDCLEAAGRSGVRLWTVEWGGVWVYAATPLRSTGRDNLVESLARRMESLNCPTLYVLSIIVSSHHKTSTDAENFNVQHYDIKAHFSAGKYIRQCKVLILHSTQQTPPDDMHYPQTLLVQQGQVSHTKRARERNKNSTEVNDYTLSITMNGHIWH